VVLDVVLDERLDEPVAVVVVGLHAELQRVVDGLGGSGEVLGEQLLLRVEVVRGALIDEDLLARPAEATDELRRIISASTRA
jgi:hypothetical protein